MINESSPRRTKIIATLGPKTDEPGILREIIQAGANVMRVNFSHGTHSEHLARIERARHAADELGKVIGILVDFQGPKIRIASFKEGAITLEQGQRFILDAELDKNAGDANQVGLDYKALPQDVVPHDILLLDDGLLSLQVTKVEGAKIYTEVVLGGVLKSKKGVNRKGGGLSAGAITEKDKEDLNFVASLPPGTVDYIALSFVKSKEDVFQARQMMSSLKFAARIVAKIERVEAVEVIDEIIQASDAVMVARGDLGVEIGYAELPAVQKSIIKKARTMNKLVITATQMMESMITNPIPTRAEVSDVANAVLDGTDAVMLSAETATGRYPTKVINMMDEVVLAAEKQRISKISQHRLDTRFERHDEAIAMAAMYLANHVEVRAIVALTESGSTPLWMSRIRSGIPIYALSRYQLSCGRMTLFRGVYPVHFDLTSYEAGEVTRYAVGLLVKRGILNSGDKVIVTKGNIMGVGGKTNTLKIITAEAID